MYYPLRLLYYWLAMWNRLTIKALKFDNKYNIALTVTPIIIFNSLLINEPTHTGSSRTIDK